MIDIRIAEFKYVRFQNTHSTLDNGKADEFLSTLIASIAPEHSKSSAAPTHGNHDHSTHSNSKQDPEQKPKLRSVRPIVNSNSASPWDWTRTEIDHWFEANEISPTIHDMYQFKTGAQMLTYAECLMNGWQEQYKQYASRHNDNSLHEHEFALFACLLKQLSSK
jgi:hypothetical protein